MFAQSINFIKEFPTGERLVVRFADSEAQRELKRNVLSATKQQVDISRLRDRTSSNINSISCSALSPQGGNTPVMSAGASETPTSDLLAADRRAPMQHPASQQQPLARNLLSSSHSAPLTPELAGQNTPTWQPFPLRINSSSADLSQTGLLAEGTKEPGSFFTARMLSSAGFTPRDLSATAAMSLTTAHGPLSAGLAAAARLAKLTSSMPAMPGANAPFHPHPSQLQLRNGMPMLRDAGFAENIQPNLRPSLEDERRNSSPAFSSVSPGVRSKTNSHQSLSGGSNTSTTAMSSGGANRSSSLASKCGGRGRVGAGHGSNNSRTQFQTARGPTATSLADGPVTPSKRDIRVQLG
ncbi:hypothetical protein K437DRAFT_108538 [Tilletiaria anomala UBC 951]|uniref:Uncharacterized protein n=1 Tax=Tilletiaria anomala (strain ATCC 24038 / CBS 436.72 / UBC 951) TaxID=1037660 RepID=A0A066W675_TILAU|nr:uncharacterized protein K437DRAFT_108538 [Tilletiaria anomala UBC 951]KDN46270.1 hypothetical protein K437DRAFT_108538 [Tilletiaria anomala UBC 951]